MYICIHDGEFDDLCMLLSRFSPAEPKPPSQYIVASASKWSGTTKCVKTELAKALGLPSPNEDRIIVTEYDEEKHTTRVIGGDLAAFEDAMVADLERCKKAVFVITCRASVVVERVLPAVVRRCGTLKSVDVVFVNGRHNGQGMPADILPGVPGKTIHVSAYQSLGPGDKPFNGGAPPAGASISHELAALLKSSRVQPDVLRALVRYATHFNVALANPKKLKQKLEQARLLVDTEDWDVDIEMVVASTGRVIDKKNGVADRAECSFVARACEYAYNQVKDKDPKLSGWFDVRRRVFANALIDLPIHDMLATMYLDGDMPDVVEGELKMHNGFYQFIATPAVGGGRRCVMHAYAKNPETVRKSMVNTILGALGGYE